MDAGLGRGSHHDASDRARGAREGWLARLRQRRGPPVLGRVARRCGTIRVRCACRSSAPRSRSRARTRDHLWSAHAGTRRRMDGGTPLPRECDAALCRRERGRWSLDHRRGYHGEEGVGALPSDDRIDRTTVAAPGCGMTDLEVLAPPVSDPNEERRAFAEIQRRLAPMFARIFPDPAAERTVVVVPSMSLPREELAKLSGANHYEERLLCMLMLLRFPRASVVYVTSEPIAPSVIDSFLHLLPGVPPIHA